MRTHLENTQPYIKALVSSLSKNPASLEGWRCIHIEHTDDASSHWYQSQLAAFKQSHKDIDCDAVMCPDNDLFIISRAHTNEQLHTFATEFKALGDASWQWGESTVYELFYDWNCVKNLLADKLSAEDSLNNTRMATNFNFGEIASLNEVFKEAKKLRKARLPLHVMVVEDDPLTRRIVTGSFKEEYALITASDAQEAVANYLLHAPDIVFLDIGLPDTSGFNVLYQIMTNDPDAYVVMFSANSYLDNITTALSAGASGFIGKPFRKEKMRQYIQDSAMHHAKNIM